MDYDLELPKIVKEVKQLAKQKEKKESEIKVLLQFPDGLKPFATDTVDQLEKKSKAQFLIYAGSNFGGCDYPAHVNIMGFDLIVNFGHVVFRR